MSHSHPHKVSICLPNLRNRPYLPERIESILAQTLVDWELVVFDNYSDDGAWEYLCARAKGEPRIRLQQAPREGMYANWNNCIRAATGKYIYIATSDDNMAPDCLEQLAAALDQNPGCGIAHCKPHLFGENTELLETWWRRASPLSLAVKGQVERPHLRFAPFDGFAHAGGETVVVSITQALIRRDVFDLVGLFPNDHGVVGDSEWHVRAGYLVNSVYVPQTWGGWRLHAAQATALNVGGLAEKRRTNLKLFKRATDLFLSRPEGVTWRSQAAVALALADLHVRYLEGRGTLIFWRMAKLVMQGVALGLGAQFLRWGPARSFAYIKNPACYGLDLGRRTPDAHIRFTPSGLSGAVQ